MLKSCYCLYKNVDIYITLLLSFIDIERPKFSKNDECQNGITITNETLPDKSYGLINFDAIGVTDNSGDEVVVVSSPPGYELGRSYQMNITKLRQPLVVTFTATDKSNNQATCRFLVEIKGA